MWLLSCHAFIVPRLFEDKQGAEHPWCVADSVLFCHRLTLGSLRMETFLQVCTHLLKVCMYVCRGLKMCMLFKNNPQINFCHQFQVVTLKHFSTFNAINVYR